MLSEFLTSCTKHRKLLYKSIEAVSECNNKNCVKATTVLKTLAGPITIYLISRYLYLVHSFLSRFGQWNDFLLFQPGIGHSCRDLTQQPLQQLQNNSQKTDIVKNGFYNNRVILSKMISNDNF